MDNSQNPLGVGPETTGASPAIRSADLEALKMRDTFARMTPDAKRDFVLTYQQPRPDQIPKFVAVREGIEAAYKAVEENCPPCADRSHTLRLLRDARMWANAAIALDGVV